MENCMQNKCLSTLDLQQMSFVNAYYSVTEEEGRQRKQLISSQFLIYFDQKINQSINNLESNGFYIVIIIFILDKIY